jgi:transcriptional regulator with PAS, ATPase and Fis domain
MNVLYILLGGKRGKQLKGMSPAMYVTYDSAKDGGTESLPWPSNAPPLRPISYLINRARLNAWRVEAEQILKRYGLASSWGHVLDVEPEWFAKLEPDQFCHLNTITDGNQDAVLIAHELKNSAQKITKRNTAFVFPAKWADDIAEPATKLTSAIAKELCEYLREAPVDQALPWTFLSMDTNSDSASRDTLGELISSLHSEMLAEKSELDVVAWSQKSGAVLLSGPTGSGKSYAARLLATAPKYRCLVEINLAAVSEELLESRMRGYAAGTFTGAEKKGREGWFEKANGGVLFLDEFQSVSTASQVQLLDLLSAVSDVIHIARTGEDDERHRFNVKVILAINENIDTLLRCGRLRKDVYFRVRTVEKFLSLKERLDRDLDHRYLRSLLVSYRWKSLRTIEQLCCLEGGWQDMVPTFFPEFSLDALTELASHDWEGNFRELERVAFDIYYETDYLQQSIIIDRARVKHAVTSWHATLLGGLAENISDGLNKMERKKLNDIQQALRESDFIISGVLKRQPYYKSNKPLKSFLQSHADILDKDILSESRMIKFLKLEPERT